MSIIYITYDVDFKRYLRSLKIQDLLYGLNPKSLKPFWVYERTIEFEKALKDWYDSKN